MLETMYNTCAPVLWRYGIWDRISVKPLDVEEGNTVEAEEDHEHEKDGEAHRQSAVAPNVVALLVAVGFLSAPHAL